MVSEGLLEIQHLPRNDLLAEGQCQGSLKIDCYGVVLGTGVVTVLPLCAKVLLLDRAVGLGLDRPGQHFSFFQRVQS